MMKMTTMMTVDPGEDLEDDGESSHDSRNARRSTANSATQMDVDERAARGELGLCEGE